MKLSLKEHRSTLARILNYIGVYRWLVLLSLALAGGIVPPVLLPGPVRRLSGLSPVTWLRQLAAWPMGYPVDLSTWACLAASTVGMAALALALYRRRVERQEVAM